VLGEEFFARLAAAWPEPAQATKLRALQLLEAQTRQLTARFADPSSAALPAGEEARRLADAAAGLSWVELMAALTDGLAGPLADYRRMLELAPDPDHEELARRLISHEQAVEAFAQGELEGKAAALDPVLGQLDPAGRARVGT
jgi:hypothetical protein